MALDSDTARADELLTVTFYEFEKDPYKGVPFVRITMPGDKLSIIEQPVRDDHKQRFPRQWQYYLSTSSGLDASAIGTPLGQWNQDEPESFNDNQLVEMQILKFQTVEQIAQASDIQLQRIGMGAAGLRERARAYLSLKNRSDHDRELSDTKAQLAALQAQMAELLDQKRGPARARKDVNADDHASTGAAGHE